MSNQTEKAFKAIQKAMEGIEFETQEDMEEFLNNFIDDYNQKLSSQQELDSYDYLEMAQEADDKADAIKYAKKALKADPYCLDAEMIIAQSKAHDMKSLKSAIKKVIRKGEEQLIEQGISMTEDVGHFYSIFATRPYMRARKAYLELLLAHGWFGLALEEAEEHIRLCKSDNLGVRYSLMALYCFFEDEDKAIKLFRKYKEESAFMLLPLIALYYKKDNHKKMKTYIEKLQKNIPDVTKALDMIFDSEDEQIDEIISSGMYRAHSIEEVILAFYENSFLYDTMDYFAGDLYKELDIE